MSTLFNWKNIDKKTIANCAIFDVNAITRQHEDSGHTATYYSLDTPDAVTVIPVVMIHGEEHFIMIRQHRHGTQQVYHEFPSGLIDRGETPEQAAHREMAEEIGMSGSVQYIGYCHTNPAYINNIHHNYIAFNLSPLSNPPAKDQDEFFEQVNLPVWQVIQNMGQGEFAHALMIQALYFYLKLNHFTVPQPHSTPWEDFAKH
jgi:8-oxo-dGTP pyrophosphatase MutT (NUDIX family)